MAICNWSGRFEVELQTLNTSPDMSLYLLYSSLSEGLCDCSTDVARSVTISDLGKGAQVKAISKVATMLCDHQLP